MSDDIIENATDALKREITSRVAFINWEVAKLSKEISSPYREFYALKIDSDLKQRICDMVMLTSFNAGFYADIQKAFRPYKFETNAPYHDRRAIKMHAKRTIWLWEKIMLSLRKRKIIVLPGE
jgi:hypothetical protein